MSILKPLKEKSRSITKSLIMSKNSYQIKLHLNHKQVNLVRGHNFFGNQINVILYLLPVIVSGDVINTVSDFDCSQFV